MFWKVTVESSSSRSDSTVLLTNATRSSDEPVSGVPSVSPCSSSDNEGTTTSSSSSCATINTNDIVVESHPTINRTGHARSSVRRRTVVVAFELLVVLSFVIYQSIYLLEYVANVYITQFISIQRWNDDKRKKYCTYYGRFCYKTDVTASSPEELLLTTNFVDHMNKHGALLMPNILSEKTASDLRAFVIEENIRRGKSISLMEMTNRWSFSLVIDQHPSVAAAVKEILSNDVLMNGMEELIGQIDPAFIELSTITSAYGAVKQEWHSDSQGDASGALFTRTFIPSYSVFIPLQNTTEAMGATVVSPGTHMCFFNDTKTNITGFPLSGPNDNWPVGAGVLMNSQLAHYGPAYTDPNGEPRVILIPTFTHRPLLSRNKRVETRIVSHGTVYGIDWTQLGHTVSDWLSDMRKLWRTLRSLNIVNNHPSYAGWNFWDQNLNRIAVNDVDIYPNDLKEYLPNPMLADVLFGDLVPDSDEIEEAEKASVLTQFSLNVINRWTAIFSKVQWSLVGIFFCSLYFAKGPVFPKFGPSFCRMLAVKLIILAAYYKFRSNLDTSPWANNIRSGRLLNLPEYVVQYPDTPSTIPTLIDILQTNHIQSEWLGAYRKMIDAKHPGNNLWYNKLIPEYARGYKNLPTQLQVELCTSVLQSIKYDQRRILTKNAQGAWTVVSNVEASRFCHTSLMKASDPFVHEIIEQIDFLRAETSYGYFRDTVLHQQHIPSLLMVLRDEISTFNNTLLYKSSNNDSNSNVIKVSSKGSRQKASVASPFNLQANRVPHPISNSKFSRSPSTIPYVVSKNVDNVDVEEPFPAAWLQEGDLVEVLHKDLDEKEFWYTATITDITTYRRLFDVVFEDGVPSQNVKPDKVRRPMPYKIDEEIQVDLKGTYKFLDGRIVAIIDDETTFHVGVYKTKNIHSVPRARVRRFPAYIQLEDDDDDDDDDDDEEDGDELSTDA